MSWILWVILAWFALNAVAGPFLIGKQVTYKASGYVVSLLFYIFVTVSVLVIFL